MYANLLWSLIKEKKDVCYNLGKKKSNLDARHHLRIDIIRKKKQILIKLDNTWNTSMKIFGRKMYVTLLLIINEAHRCGDYL